jgi:hypothetical protein
MDNAGTHLQFSPANNQQFPHNLYTSAIQPQWQALPKNYRRENHNNYNSQRMISTREEEENILCNDNDNNEWQV